MALIRRQRGRSKAAFRLDRVGDSTGHEYLELLDLVGRLHLILFPFIHYKNMITAQ